MRMYRKCIIGLVLMIFLFSTVTTVSAITIRPDSSTATITIAAIITIATAILGYLFIFGGIKYVTPENVLDTEIRKHLYDYIDEYPGSHLREIARELDLKPSNAAWHLRKLEQTNLIRSRSIGGKKVFYLVEGGMEARTRAVADSILKNENARNIMQYLTNHPGKHLLEIAHALNINHHVVKWHLNKLHLAELVEGDTTNSAYPVYYPTEIGRQSLEMFNEYLSTTIGKAG